MAAIEMKCRNCGGQMEIVNNQFVCAYCGTIVLNIVDAKIDADISIISPEEFARKIEASKSQFVINLNDKLEVFDVKTKVINKRIVDASALLREGLFSQVRETLREVPDNILSAERLRYLASFNVKTETELLAHNGYVENTHYHNILKLADAQTRATYIKLASFCREKYDARNAATAEIKEGERLLEVNLLQDAAIYAQEMCQKYPMYAITWMFLAHVKRQINPHYACEREWGIIHYCFDFPYYNGNFPYGLNAVFSRKFGHNVKLSELMGATYSKWGEFLGKGTAILSSGGLVGCAVAGYYVVLMVIIAVIMAPVVFLINFPRFIRGRLAIEKVGKATGLNNANTGSIYESELKKQKKHQTIIIVWIMIGILAIALAIIIPVTLNNEWHEGIRYKQKSGKLYLDDAQNCTTDTVIIPDNIRGMYVVSINYVAFQGSALKSVTIPASVETIKEYAFEDCSNLTKVTFAPNSQLKSIDKYAFLNCDILSIVIPDGVTSIAQAAFANNSKLTSVVVPNSVTFIGSGAFGGCDSLKEITLPFVGKTESPEYARWAVLGYIFGDGELFDNDMDKSHTTYKTSDNTNYTTQYPGFWGDFYFCIPKTLKKITITKQTDIPERAFNNCDLIETIIYTQPITSIGENAFNNCTAEIINNP